MEHEQQARLLEIDQEGILSLVGDHVAVRVLLELSSGEKRFSAFQLGVSSKTLSQRLKRLEEQELITRTAYAEIPPRVEYALTPKGKEFVTILDGLLQWEQSWLQPEL